MAKDGPSSSRLEILVAFAIALVSITTAIVTWRASVVASSAGDASHKGLIDALKKEAAAGENIRMLYQEAAYAGNYASYKAQLGSLENSGDGGAQAQAKQLEQFLLPSLAQMAPLASNPAYLKKDGTFNLDKRLADITAEYPDLDKLNPQVLFARADQYYAEQRWLMLDIVLLVITLFWLTLAQIGGRRLRLATLTIGSLVYVIGLTWFGAVELIFFFSRGSL